MRVKRYLVDTMPEAMLQIRKDLGSDAVILSTKETKIGGFLGLFRQKKIEVVAAVENEEQVKNNKPQPAAARNSVAVPKKAVPQAYKKTAELTSSAHAASAASEMAAASTTSAPDQKEYAPEVAARSEVSFSNNLEDILATKEFEEGQAVKLSEQILVKSQESFPPNKDNERLENLSRSTAEDKLLEELREMKAWMAKISRQSAMQQTLPEVLQKLQDQLLQQDIDADIIQEWIGAAHEFWERNGKTSDEAELETFMRDQIKSFLSNRFGGGIAQDTKIVYVAGPTGVGKTTTIAKLAAEQLFKYHRKVGFITSDTYRISAVEQLRTYASILNVPLEVVQSPGDMQRSLQRLNYCDLILMDTAGRNYRNELLVSELQSLFSPEEKSETYLVLSLTSKTRDMMKITEHFSKYGLDKVIFTKLDETGSYGSIINLIHEYPLLLSYMTNGQNVPDDLILPGDQTLGSLLLGEEST
ncbi:flagellar biosynthesis protein FlhF [Paenibacillus sp. HJL G12]|uniref:Flagellar biosynthesis protein FlhF n=1 Tax=Paenibacillus dendrobii TaxID=2691084 RepID=A0A7X3IK65_9BACL|nr:flagellar biosynthesis protein FlhF [Paenibacillus dendrobii]MWV43532.1 flagellar biosynthesis protein FlhF [Paenibacillus dendrobii]